MDKLTSGVCVFAKNAKSAAKIHNLFNRGQVQKEYLALVDGQFPSGRIFCDFPLENFTRNSLRQVKTYSSPKQSVTIFERLEFDSRTSLVRCLPQTGRTHQIRIHLKMLGHPIVNDSTYNERDFRLLKRGPSDEQYGKALESIKLKKKVSEDIPWKEESAENWISKVETNLSTFPFCVSCEMKEMNKAAFNQEDSMFLCLHAFKYTLGSKGTFESEMPRWVQDKSLVDNIFTQRIKEV